MNAQTYEVEQLKKRKGKLTEEHTLQVYTKTEIKKRYRTMSREPVWIC